MLGIGSFSRMGCYSSLSFGTPEMCGQMSWTALLNNCTIWKSSVLLFTLGNSVGEPDTGEQNFEGAALTSTQTEGTSQLFLCSLHTPNHTLSSNNSWPMTRQNVLADRAWASRGGASSCFSVTSDSLLPPAYISTTVSAACQLPTLLEDTRHFPYPG